MQNVPARDDPCCIVLMVSEGFHHNGSSCSISTGLNNEAFAVSHFAATLRASVFLLQNGNLYWDAWVFRNQCKIAGEDKLHLLFNL